MQVVDEVPSVLTDEWKMLCTQVFVRYVHAYVDVGHAHACILQNLYVLIFLVVCKVAH